MATCRIVPSLLGSDAILAARARTRRKNNGWPYRPLFENMHRPVFSHSNHPAHFSHSSISSACLWTLPSQLYVTSPNLESNYREWTENVYRWTTFRRIDGSDLQAHRFCKIRPSFRLGDLLLADAGINCPTRQRGSVLSVPISVTKEHRRWGGRRVVASKRRDAEKERGRDRQGIVQRW